MIIRKAAIQPASIGSPVRVVAGRGQVDEAAVRDRHRGEPEAQQSQCLRVRRSLDHRQDDHRDHHDVAERIGQRDGQGEPRAVARRLGHGVQRRRPRDGQQCGRRDQRVQAPLQPAAGLGGEEVEAGHDADREEQEADVGDRGERRLAPAEQLVVAPDALAQRPGQAPEARAEPGPAQPAGRADGRRHRGGGRGSGCGQLGQVVGGLEADRAEPVHEQHDDEDAESNDGRSGRAVGDPQRQALARRTASGRCVAAGPLVAPGRRGRVGGQAVTSG